MKVRVEDCDDAAFALIAPRLRAEDQEEWRLASGHTVTDFITDHDYKLPAGAGTSSRIGYHGETGEALLAWGVGPIPWFAPEANTGWVWLVATPEAVPVAKSIHRELKVELKRLQALYPNLMTASHVGNRKHHDWLKWLGFTTNGFCFEAGPYHALWLPFILNS